MPCVISIRNTSLLPGGIKQVSGCATMNAGYVSGGDNLDLSNYLKASKVPLVAITSESGYVLEHDQGNAASGRVKAFQNIFNTAIWNGVAANVPLYEVHTGKDMSAVNFSFIAKGQAY